MYIFGQEVLWIKKFCAINKSEKTLDKEEEEEEKEEKEEKKATQ